MGERKNQAPVSARVEPFGPAFLRWSRWVPLAIVATLSLLAWLVITEEARAVSRLKQQTQQENRLRMESSAEQVNDYLEEIYSVLLFISQNDDVIALRPGAHSFIQKLYDHGWESHQ